LTDSFLSAAAQYGLKTNPVSSSIHYGAQAFLKNIQGGRRHSVSDAYIRPIKARKNLDILTHTLVDKIQFEDKFATELRCYQHGKTQTLRCTKEIILAAGAFNSPAILQRSGIGDPEFLDSLQIPLRIPNVAVGKNLQDHVICGLAYRLKKQYRSLDILQQTFPLLKELMKYIFTHKGPLSSNIAEAGAFLKVEESNIVPDLEFHFAPLFFIDHGLMVPKGFGFSVGPTLLHPKSKGTVSIVSADAHAAPAIDPNYFSDLTDLRYMIEGIKITKEICRQSSLQTWIEGIEVPAKIPETEEEYSTLIREYTQSLYHPVGTCSLGSLHNSVVGNDLRVWGCENLRVVDASVIPALPSSNTQSTVLMIAEYASDMIKRNSNYVV
jgi:choline dehydrogenase